VPIISVGNLAVGGQGKTPHVEYLVLLLSPYYRVAVVSRGYKRNTSGFLLADKNSTAQSIGDEPYQIFSKFPKITVAVDSNRVRAIRKLLANNLPPQVIILDDAFQHRSVRPGFSILLSDYSSLYLYDSMLPGGRLRESKYQSKRADIIAVTKCPEDINPLDIRITAKLFKLLSYQSLYFSTYKYGEIQPLFNKKADGKITLKQMKTQRFSILLTVAIANPQPIIEYLKQYSEQIDSVIFADHHFFEKRDYQLIEKKFNALQSIHKIIITTEKDATRIGSDYPKTLQNYTYLLPIEVQIINNQEQLFIKTIKNYVAEDLRNG
jgi:tetraacyldisaccharide 4'-kinase